MVVLQFSNNHKNNAYIKDFFGQYCYTALQKYCPGSYQNSGPGLKVVRDSMFLNGEK